LKSPLEGFSPGVHLRGRCHGDRIGGRPARSVHTGAVSTACLSSVQRLKSPLEGFSPGVHTGAVSTAQAAWRSAIEIASGRLFAGRPPAWTLPQRPHRRSPGAKRPHRRGFNRSGCLGVQRLKSPLEGFSPGVHLRGRCHSDRLGGRPARSVRSGAVSTACLSSVQRLKSPLEGFSPGVHTGAVSTACLSSVQRLKSPLEGFSPGVHLRGRCHGDRIGGRPARSVHTGAVSTACLSSVQRLKSPLEGFSPGVHTGAVSTAQAAWRSAIEIAPGRLFAGRPPAWTLPRRPHRRSPGAKRPHRRGFNRSGCLAFSD